MNSALRDPLISGYERLIEAITLPDPDDRHVLAAAIKAKAQVIVTNNLRDYPAAVLSDWDIEAKSADDFLMDQFHIDAVALHVAVTGIADSRNNPPSSVDDVLDLLKRDGLVQIAAALRR